MKLISTEHPPSFPSIDAVDAVSETFADCSLADALDVYLELLKSGAKPSRKEMLGRFPHLASELPECLEGVDLIQSAARRLDGASLELASFAVVAIPERLGDFRILREVGRGGMGVVYEAVQDSLDRRVALKVLHHTANFDPKQRRRFQIEAQAAAQLNHDHIATVFAVGITETASFYAMHFIEGGTLANVIERLSRESPQQQFDPAENSFHDSNALETEPNLEAGLRVSTDFVSQLERLHGKGMSGPSRDYCMEAARIGVQACEALAHAHSLGVVHRDVKPSNLMLDKSGKLWVTDFGLARFQGDPGVTHTGELLGTLRYMSPEQALGKGMIVDQRTDVYSLGATLYELLTLCPVLDGRDRNALVRQVVEVEPVPPRRIAKSIPRDLETIVIKAISKDPRERYSTIAEFAEDLEGFLADQPIKARPVSPLARAVKWARRRRTLVASACLILFLSVSVAGLVVWIEKTRTSRALDKARASHAREREYLRFVISTTDQMNMEMMRKLGSVDPRQSRELAESYERVLRIYERIAPQYADDPAMRDLAAQAYNRIGFIHLKVDALKGAPGASAPEGKSRLRESGRSLPQARFRRARPDRAPHPPRLHARGSSRAVHGSGPGRRRRAKAPGIRPHRRGRGARNQQPRRRTGPRLQVYSSEYVLSRNQRPGLVQIGV